MAIQNMILAKRMEDYEKQVSFIVYPFSADGFV